MLFPSVGVCMFYMTEDRRTWLDRLKWSWSRIYILLWSWSRIYILYTIENDPDQECIYFMESTLPMPVTYIPTNLVIRRKVCNR